MKKQEARQDVIRASAHLYSALDALEAAMMELEDYKDDAEVGIARVTYWMAWRNHYGLKCEYEALEKQIEREGGDDDEA